MTIPPVWPGNAQGSRNSYVQQRVATRMQARGEPMTLRRVSKLPGPVPYIYPPDFSLPISVNTGVIASDSNSYLGLIAPSINGRLVAGDQIIAGAVTWTVQTMPDTITTDSDGIAQCDIEGNPIFGSPTLYSPDCLAAGGEFTVIPVIAPGNPNPAASIASAVTFNFAADTTVYGRVLTLEEMTAKGWTQVNTLGVNIAAAVGGNQILAPQVDDVIWINGEERSIMAVGQIFRNGINFVYSLQCH